MKEQCILIENFYCRMIQWNDILVAISLRPVTDISNSGTDQRKIFHDGTYKS